MHAAELSFAELICIQMATIVYWAMCSLAGIVWQAEGEDRIASGKQSYAAAFMEEGAVLMGLTLRP